MPDDRTPDAKHPPATPGTGGRLIDIALFSVVAAQLIFVGLLLWRHIEVTQQVYGDAIKAAADQNLLRHAVTLGFARALDFAIVKSAAVFLGFGLVMIGALYVLKVTNAAFQLDATVADQSRLSLQSTSAGLVLATVGAALVTVALFSQSDVSITGDLSAADLASRIIVQERGANSATADGDAATAITPVHPAASGTNESATAGLPSAVPLTRPRRGAAAQGTAAPRDLLVGRPSHVRVRFNRASTELHASAVPTLRTVVEALRKGAVSRITIEAHGPSPLAERRAHSVRDAMLQFGAAAGTVYVTSYGETLPSASDDTDEGYATVRLEYSR